MCVRGLSVFQETDKIQDRRQEMQQDLAEVPLGSFGNDVMSDKIVCLNCGHAYQGLAKCPNCGLTKEEARQKAEEALAQEALRGGAGSRL